jgi:hypothetical protein
MAHRMATRWFCGFAAMAVGIGLAITVNPSLAVGAGSPPQPCSPSGTVAQQSPPVDCPMLTVQPSTNLIDLQLVNLRGRDFSALTSIATIQCAANASSQNDCDLSTLFIISASSTGTFSQKRYVRRIISPAAGTLDCASAPKVCIMAAANLSNYLEASSVALTFNPNVPPQTPTVFAVPATGLKDHQVIKVTGAGMIPNNGIQIAECAAGTPSYTTCEYSTAIFVQTGPSGKFSALWPVQRILFLQTGTLDCGSTLGACVVFAGNFYGSLEQATAPLAFNPNIPPQTQTISASPNSALKDHQLVQVVGNGYTPGANIAVIQCRSGAASQGDCDYGTATTATPGLTGQFTITYPVHRILSFYSGPLDCASAPQACTVVAANTFRNSEAASAPLGFDPKSPPVVATISVAPNTGLVDNQATTVTGSGFTPFSTVSVVQCGKEAALEHNFSYCSSSSFFGGGGVSAQANGSGAFSVTLFVHPVIGTSSGLVDCASQPGACVVAGSGFNSAEAAFNPISFH